MKIIFFNCVLLLILGLAISFTSCKIEIDDEVRYPHNAKEEMVDLGAYKLNARFLGVKRPAIALMSGIAGTTADWRSMESDISKLGLIINYDREGIGKSDWQNRPKDSETIAEELYELLEAKSIEGPYILVAHSLAGIHARVFTDIYKNKVAGILLVDPTPENLIDSLLAPLSPEEQQAIRNGIQEQEAEFLASLPEGGIKEEFKAINTIYAQARALSFKTDVPVAVISSMKPGDNGSPESLAMAKKLRDQMLQQMCTGKTKHYLTATAGHFVQKDEPELVLEALEWVIDNR